MKYRIFSEVTGDHYYVPLREYLFYYNYKFGQNEFVDFGLIPAWIVFWTPIIDIFYI